MIVRNSLASNVAWEPASERDHRSRAECEIRFEMRIAAEARDIFPYFIDGKQMKTWLAPEVSADPQPGGVFRLSDLNGSWIEGRYLEIGSYQRVALTWGGIHGLEIGESIVEFSLLSDASGTILRLQHADLPEPASDIHRLGWQKWGLPKLKAVAEGQEPRGTFLGSLAEAREQFVKTYVQGRCS